MSRAFVSESDGIDDEQIPEFRNPLPPGARNYMTPEGAERLTAELNGLLSVERPALASMAIRLKSAGEEADAVKLKQAQFDLMVLDKKIEYLSGLASTMEIVEPRTSNTDTVGFGAKVTVQAEEKLVLRIVGAYESDPAAGNISWFSPLAKALMGAKAGDQVNVRLPEGETRLKVVSVQY